MEVVLIVIDLLCPELAIVGGPRRRRTDYCKSVGLVESCGLQLVSGWTASIGCTGEVEEVRVLVELVEHGPRADLDVRRGEEGDGLWREGLGEPDAALVVLLGGDAGCDWMESQSEWARRGLSLPCPGPSRCG